MGALPAEPSPCESIRNSRDRAIVRLWHEGKTAGEIAKTLGDLAPKNSDQPHCGIAQDLRREDGALSRIPKTGISRDKTGIRRAIDSRTRGAGV